MWMAQTCTRLGLISRLLCIQFISNIVEIIASSMPMGPADCKFVRISLYFMTCVDNDLASDYTSMPLNYFIVTTQRQLTTADAYTSRISLNCIQIALGKEWTSDGIIVFFMCNEIVSLQWLWPNVGGTSDFGRRQCEWSATEEEKSVLRQTVVYGRPSHLPHTLIRSAPII